jgi:tetratricopeptide (TPR) repeat protein
MRGRRGSKPERKRRRPSEALNPRQRKELRRAHILMEKGELDNAAELIERIAVTIYDLQMLKLAPRLFIQAGRARILSGQEDRGVELLKQGLAIWADTGRKKELLNVYQRLSQELPAFGFQNAAGQISRWLKERYPKLDHPVEEAQREPAAHRRMGIPLKCPECEAPLHPDELDWKGSPIGECPYCGSFIQT